MNDRRKIEFEYENRNGFNCDVFRSVIIMHEYRFVYSYNKPEHSYSGNDVEKCTFANHEFDLYEGDGCFVGSIYADYATIRITIYSTDSSSIQQMVL